uniref:hypothetical protein n=1 Tax=Nonomuraea sp. CA-252377 TaxID=3240003 RepID=UPI003F494320
MVGKVVALRPVPAAVPRRWLAERAGCGLRRGALAVIERYLARRKLGEPIVRAYRRQCAAYVTWLSEREHAVAHADAFDDVGGGGEAVLIAYEGDLRQRRFEPASINGGLPGIGLMFELGAWLRLDVKWVGMLRAGEPVALSAARLSGRRAAGRVGRCAAGWFGSAARGSPARSGAPAESSGRRDERPRAGAAARPIPAGRERSERPARGYMRAGTGCGGEGPHLGDWSG